MNTPISIHRPRAVRISQKTTLSVHEVLKYLEGGLGDAMILALHDLACEYNVPTENIVRAFFIYDPIDGEE